MNEQANTTQAADQSSGVKMSTVQEKIDALGSMHFEPWKHEEDEWVPPSNEEWVKLANPHLITIRLAWLTMYKSKPELMQVIRDLPDEEGHDLMVRMIGSIEFFQGILALLEGAETRILCAGSAVDMEDAADD